MKRLIAALTCLALAALVHGQTTPGAPSASAGSVSGVNATGPYSPTSFTSNALLTGGGTGPINATSWTLLGSVLTDSSSNTFTASAGTETFSGTFAAAVLQSTGAVNSGSGMFGGALTGTGGTSYGYQGNTFYIKSVTLLTSGSPADIASITIPSSWTRWKLAGSNGLTAYAETASGTLAATTVGVYDATGGGGPASLLNGSTATLSTCSAAGTLTYLAGGGSVSAGNAVGTTQLIVVRQTVNSANAGTVSFYFLLQPLF